MSNALYIPIGDAIYLFNCMIVYVVLSLYFLHGRMVYSSLEQGIKQYVVQKQNEQKL